MRPAVSPVIPFSPSGVSASVLMATSACSTKVYTGVQEVVSHTTALPSSAAVTARLPSGVNATPFTGPRSCLGFFQPVTTAPVLASSSHSSPLASPHRTCLPSGENAAAQIAVPPVVTDLDHSLPVPRSLSLTVPPSSP